MCGRAWLNIYFQLLDDFIEFQIVGRKMFEMDFNFNCSWATDAL